MNQIISETVKKTGSDKAQISDVYGILEGDQNAPFAEMPKPVSDIPKLVTIKTCMNCPSAKKALDNAGIQYMNIDADENQELVDSYGIKSAPTLIYNGEKYVGLSNILGWIKENK